MPPLRNIVEERVVMKGFFEQIRAGTGLSQKHCPGAGGGVPAETGQEDTGKGTDLLQKIEKNCHMSPKSY